MIYQKIPLRILCKLWGFWFPFLGAGISVVEISEDLQFVRTRLKLRWWNRNYVGTQFGGSMFAMTDPIYMVMLLKNLGPDYIVWDKAASIRYLKPGQTDVTAEFRLSDQMIGDIRVQVDSQGKMDWQAKVEIKDLQGVTVAEVDKVLYVRKKKKQILLKETRSPLKTF